MKLKHTCPIALLAFIAWIAFFVSSCVEVGGSYTPPFIPLTFTIDSNGVIGIHGNTSIVTEIGTFGLEAGIEQTLQPQNNTLLVILRHQQNGSVVDTAYQINTQQEIRVSLDGKTTLDVTNNRVVVDASQANVTCLEVKDPNSNDNACEQILLAATTQPNQQTQATQTCPNVQGQEGPIHQADGSDWKIDSNGGGAFIVNFYFPNTQQYNGNYKVLVPEGVNSIIFHAGGGSYWLWPQGCMSAAQGNYDTLDHYISVNLQDLENQGLVSVS